MRNFLKTLVTMALSLGSAHLGRQHLGLQQGHDSAGLAETWGGPSRQCQGAAVRAVGIGLRTGRVRIAGIFETHARRVLSVGAEKGISDRV